MLCGRRIAPNVCNSRGGSALCGHSVARRKAKVITALSLPVCAPGKQDIEHPEEGSIVIHLGCYHKHTAFLSSEKHSGEAAAHYTVNSRRGELTIDDHESPQRITSFTVCVGVLSPDGIRRKRLVHSATCHHYNRGTSPMRTDSTRSQSEQGIAPLHMDGTGVISRGTLSPILPPSTE